MALFGRNAALLVAALTLGGCALGALPGLGAGEVCRDVGVATRERGRVCGISSSRDSNAWEAECSRAVALHPVEEAREAECLRAIGEQACDTLNVPPPQCDGLFVKGL